MHRKVRQFDFDGYEIGRRTVLCMLQCDLRQRQVNQWEIETLCREHSFIGWTETSAKDDLMVGDCMRYVRCRPNI